MRRKLAALTLVVMSVLIVTPVGADDLGDISRNEDGYICLRSKLLLGEDRQRCFKWDEN